MLILSIHLLLAAVYTLSVIGLAIAAALRKVVPIIHVSLIASFASVVGSGVVLIIASPSAMTQFCTSTLVASLCGAAAWVAYRRRITALQAE